MNKIKTYVLLNIMLLMLSFGGILSKLASKQIFLSIPFILLYFGTILVLFLYAIVWQQILKYIPLTVAYANKGVCLIWGLIFGKIFFGEIITFNMILGAIVVFLGILMVVSDEG
ncbi:transporter [Clostridium beijerinckii]|uniref:transporter n=1 Tax=Clostridium beijerinckii TaxID=1520 RepID=UPI00136145D4|nr:transporter [Clostridium beijerinckii]MZK52789.1 transporter [Clostridium beijerinckii]MZK60890.1 transporter [Clostridium beijerinckii]MZK71096.1 transporter [Clostridium beijerinckii]MZK76454.1 transporter [Clostridium beijerinckii]MZK85947.1 transporter [Clostridium beijerinckii]